MNKDLRINELQETKEKLRIAIYGRISTRERALNGYGLDNQIRKSIEYLKLYEIYDNAAIKVYRDDGFSAGNMKRSGMIEVISKIKNNEIDVLIIYKLDRLSRNVVNVYDFIRMVMDLQTNRSSRPN